MAVITSINDDQERTLLEVIIISTIVKSREKIIINNVQSQKKTLFFFKLYLFKFVRFKEKKKFQQKILSWWENREDLKNLHEI